MTMGKNGDLLRMRGTNSVSIASMGAGAILKMSAPTSPTRKWMMMKIKGICSVTATVSGSGPIALYLALNEFTQAEYLEAMRDGAGSGVTSLFPLNQGTQPGNERVERPAWLLGILDAEGLSGTASFVFDEKITWVYPEDANFAFFVFNMENSALSASWGTVDVRHEVSGKWL